MPRIALALAASLAALAARAQTSHTPPPEPPPGGAPTITAPAQPSEPAASEPAPGRPTVAREAVLEEVSGTVRGVDREAHRLEVETSTGAVTLSLDRNTMVYTTAGLATVLAVVPGARIRAGRNAEHLAYWVQVFAPRAEPGAPSTPGQGTGPAGGGAAPAGESTGEGLGPSTPPTAVPGGVPPGTAGGAPPGR